MKRLCLLITVLFGASLAVLRLFELRSAYDTGGLPVRSPLPLLSAAVLIAAVLALALAARRLPPRDTLDGTMAHYFPFDGTLPLFLTVLGCFALFASCAMKLLAGLRGTELLLAFLEALSAAVLLYVLFSLRREADFLAVVLLFPACTLVLQIIITYRRYACDPILGHFYVSTLAVCALCLAALEIAAFAFRSGSLRMFAWSAGTAAVLCMGACADTALASLAAYLGAALILLGFLLAMKTK